MIGYGAAIATALGIIDRFIPSRKAAVIERLAQLEAQYHYALIHKKDTEAAALRKQMALLRKRIEVCGVQDS